MRKGLFDDMISALMAILITLVLPLSLFCVSALIVIYAANTEQRFKMKLLNDLANQGRVQLQVDKKGNITAIPLPPPAETPAGAMGWIKQEPDVEE